ncbi:hypothetical protein [Fodinibius halophilus]|uniref:Uncharacterized protein n=1 Tax=Fodinibius halophilus TaxID=1736908 RepID=A0A6M1T5W0_9BACT|nr:hypothetical protein [Fodinibius halophilus]NGP88033.1 hypothetical protein [Fodinibius halophilus]
MEPRQWDFIESVLDEALELPKNKRESFVCKQYSDTGLRKRILQLLNSIDQAEKNQFLEHGSSENEELWEEMNPEDLWDISGLGRPK